MSLAAILYPPPEERGFDEWTFQHLAHHQAIITAARQVKGATLTLENIYPVSPNNLEQFLYLHQEMHNAQNALLGINGNDLSSTDFKNKKEADAWYYLHWTEHQSAASQLGLPIL